MRASESNAQAVLRHRAEFRPVNARRKEKHARFLDQPPCEFFTPLRALVSDEGDAAAVRFAPIEEMPVVGKKLVHDGEIAADYFSVSVQDLLPRLERDSREHFGRRRVAYG